MMTALATSLEGPLIAEAAPLDADASLATLLEAAKNGDEPAADALCRAMRPRLYRAAFAIVKDPDEADDIAQEALVRTLSHRFLFGRPKSVEGWMLRVAINLARNRFRDRRRRREILESARPDELSARGSLTRGAPTALEQVIDQERRARVEAAIEALPQRQRDVVKLRLVGQLSFEEIALALDIRPDNARVTFSQARRRLEQNLEEERRGETKGAP